MDKFRNDMLNVGHCPCSDIKVVYGVFSMHEVLEVESNYHLLERANLLTYYPGCF